MISSSQFENEKADQQYALLNNVYNKTIGDHESIN
jgi:hypothetical protein